MTHTILIQINTDIFASELESTYISTFITGVCLPYRLC